jgi:cellulose synthase/poly-beta-1,6-N-acetylglucosamine synthase-like glycosyltransferase
MVSLFVLILCTVVGGTIVVLHLVMYTGLFLSAARAKCLGGVVDSRGLRATVVVPARDEEQLLPRLLLSLEKQTVQDFFIVLVNDRSSDRTGEVMAQFVIKHADRAQVVTLTDEPEIGNPKLNALVHGVDRADTDLILFTDADCVVPPTWVAEVGSCFRDERLGVVLGPIETRKEGTLLSVFHAFDHIFKYSYTAGCAGIGMPTGGFGNNLTVRKETLDAIGGLRSIEVTSTEDAALISRVRALTDWQAKALYARAVTVVTEAQKSWSALTVQELRWHTGGLFSPDVKTRLCYGFIMIYLTLSVLAVPFCFALPVLWLLPAISFVTMSLMAIISGILTRQPPLSYWLPLIPFILLSMVYNSYLTFKALLRPHLVWKGTKLDL